MAQNESEFFNTLLPGKFYRAFCCLLIFFKINFLKNSFRNTIRVSNSLDPDHNELTFCTLGNFSCFFLSSDFF